MIEVIKNDLRIQYPLIGRIKSGQIVRGWEQDLDEILKDGLRDAQPRYLFSVGGGTHSSYG